MMNSRRLPWILIASFVLFICILLGVAIGTTKIPVMTILSSFIEKIKALFGKAANIDEMIDIIVFQVRLPRVILAALIGAALSAAGVIFQGLFRNPLAEPGLIGVSSGATLGATVGILLSSSIVGSISANTPLFAFLGAVSALGLVYLLAQKDGKIAVETFLLAGVVIGSFISALVSFMMVMAGQDMPKVIMWMMGNLSSKGWNSVYISAPYIDFGLTGTFFIAKGLNLISVGEEPARYLGLNVDVFKKLAILLGSMLTAASVSVAGVIGFIGFVVPHTSRLLVGPDHRKLLPVSTIAGAAFLVLCDILARSLLAPLEIPVGIITALFGTPFYLAILRKKKLSKMM